MFSFHFQIDGKDYKLPPRAMVSDAAYHKTHGKTFAKWAVCKDVNPRKKEVLKDKTLLWRIGEENGAVADHIELSGLFASSILSYGKDKNGKLRLRRHVSFPSFRLKPDLTYSHFRYDFDSPVRLFLEDTEIDDERPVSVKIRGNLVIESDFMNGGARVVRTFSPAPHYPALIEKIEVTNLSKDNAKFLAVERRKKPKKITSRRLKSEKLSVFSKLTDYNGDFRADNPAVRVEKRLVSGATAVCYIVHYAKETDKPLHFNAEREIKERAKQTDNAFNNLKLSCGDANVDALFSHCLLRGTESIFQSPNGLLHVPGGGNFYAAQWANDQCEYANPFFPFIGDETAVKQAVNSYRLFARYILNGIPIPQSLVASATKSLITAGDRGDTEMFCSGLCRFLLALGNGGLAQEFWPAAEKAAAFIASKKSAGGVIRSDSDELEGRFPAGKYNVSVNCLAYDAFVQTAALADALGKDPAPYSEQADALKKAILSYFRGNVEGYDTYRYYKDCRVLRSWICLPAVFGIEDGAEETFKALFGDKMYRNDTLRTASDSATVWDRSLLFALRGAFLTGYKDAFSVLAGYAKARLSGAHSPYPYEAFPEGNRAQLAGESILFARAVTEGMAGLLPLSFTKLRIRPARALKLSGVHFADTVFEIDATEDLKIKIGSKYYPANGKNIFDFSDLSWK